MAWIGRESGTAWKGEIAGKSSEVWAVYLGEVADVDSRVWRHQGGEGDFEANPVQVGRGLVKSSRDGAVAVEDGLWQARPNVRDVILIGFESFASESGEGVRCC